MTKGVILPEEQLEWRKLLVDLLGLGCNSPGGAEKVRRTKAAAKELAPEEIKEQIEAALHVVNMSTVGPWKARLYKLLYPDKAVPKVWARKRQSSALDIRNIEPSGGIKRRQIAEKTCGTDSGIGTPPKLSAEAEPVSNIKKLEVVQYGEATPADTGRGDDTSTQVQSIEELRLRFKNIESSGGIKRRHIAEKTCGMDSGFGTPPKVNAEAHPVSNIKKLEVVQYFEATPAYTTRGDDTITRGQSIEEPASSSRLLQAVQSVISRTKESTTYPGKFYFSNEATGQSWWL